MSGTRLSYQTPAELEAELGRHMRTLRLRQGYTQAQLAARASVALSALKNTESGKGATLKTLAKLLKALDREDWFGTLAPEVSISPLQMLRSTAPRQRAYAPRKKRKGVQGG